MQTRCKWWACPSVLLAALSAAPPAAAQTGPELQMPSCVRGSPPLRVPDDAAQATLDAPDSRHFDDAAQRLFPLYQRGGMAPSKVLLLQRGSRWIYVTLSAQGAQPHCVSAVFAGERFDFTDRWVAKYRPRQGPVDD